MEGFLGYYLVAKSQYYKGEVNIFIPITGQLF